jgi:homoserine O-succinyltransferase
MVVLHLDTPKADRPRGAEARTIEPRWRCALVNNMPDGAFVQTEDQFLDLLATGSGSEGLDVRLYTMAGVPRAQATALRIAERYTPWTQLFEDPPDVLIVTGANPIEPSISDEPFWGDMVELLRWATGTVSSMLLSCLSAHAALAVFDGLQRRPLPFKCTGVFVQQVDGGHPLSAGLDAEVLLPHSRLSSVPTGELRGAGYQVPLSSDEVGWSVATKRIERTNVVLVQGHPEYDPTSLLREYQRDVRRYVHYERDAVPILPLHCTAKQDEDELQELHRRVTTGERSPLLVETFPFTEIGARAPWPWRSVATQLYTNWLAGVPQRSR